MLEVTVGAGSIKPTSIDVWPSPWAFLVGFFKVSGIRIPNLTGEKKYKRFYIHLTKHKYFTKFK